MVATVPGRSKSAPLALPSVLVPVLPNGGDAFALHQFEAIRASLVTVINLLPQAATKAPTTLVDGMKRLARDPWWPVAGQAADAWVYYDGAASLWRFDATAPTTT